MPLHVVVGDGKACTQCDEKRAHKGDWLFKPALAK